MPPPALDASRLTARNHVLHQLFGDHHGWLLGRLRARLGCGEDAADMAAETFAQVVAAPLRDVDGKQRSIKDFAGKVVVVFFGYTQCPDVCPTTLQELVEVKQQLGADGDSAHTLHEHILVSTLEARLNFWRHLLTHLA